MNIHGIPLKDQDVRTCPVCGSPVRVRYRGHVADHFQPINPRTGWDMRELQPTDEDTAERLREKRKGKKTVALIGLAPTSCSLAPYEDEDVEIWALNESHKYLDSWLKRWDRWFQIHSKKSWSRPVAKRGVQNHKEWLMEEHRDEDGNLKPIYMQHHYPEVPGCVEYPLHEVINKVFPNLKRGVRSDRWRSKYFSSTIAYMMGVAILEEFDRIEVYGVEMSDAIEYRDQKANMEFWIGFAMASGIEVWLPENCALMTSTLYGGDEQGEGW